MNYYINFSNEIFLEQQNYLSSKYKEYGFVVKSYSPYHISEFINQNPLIFNNSRGFGYWAWKPYLILKTMYDMEDGDLLLYTDCGDDVSSNPISFLQNYLTLNDILLVKNKHNHKSYTKRDCFFLMECDFDKFHNQLQLEAGIISLKKTKFTTEFITKWLDFCKIYDIISDEVKYMENYDDFIDHRHDQSILTNLSTIYNIKTIDIESMMKYFSYGVLKNKIK